MLERCESKAQFDGYIGIPVSDVPTVWQFGVLFYPVAAGCRTPFEADVRTSRPLRFRQCFRPHRLGFRTDQYPVAKPFELFKVTAIDEFVIVPMLWGEELDTVCRQDKPICGKDSD